MEELYISSGSEYDMNSEVASIQAEEEIQENELPDQNEEQNRYNEAVENNLRLEIFMLKSGLNKFISTFHRKGKLLLIYK